MEEDCSFTITRFRKELEAGTLELDPELTKIIEESKYDPDSETVDEWANRLTNQIDNFLD
jgi:hypothetical protein